MKSSKTSNHARPVAFFLIAVILIFTIGFAAGGWQSVTNNSENSGNVDDKNDDADNDKDAILAPQEPEIYIPQFVDLITGLETDEANSKSAPRAFLMSGSHQLYGISSASLVVEFPTENNSSRLLAYISGTTLPTKIGSLAPTRNYINNIAASFGGIVVTKGADDTIVYEGADISAYKIDLSKNGAYSYTEYTDYTYTNSDLISSATDNLSVEGKSTTLPFQFVDFGCDELATDKSAYNIIVPFSSANETVFTYSSQSSAYVLSKNGELKRDMLNDKKITFENVFILFADATTYETATASEMILHTNTTGKGLYFTNGTQKSFEWRMDASSNLIFTDESGDIITVNRGTSYIGFMKSSMYNQISVN